MKIYFNQVQDSDVEFFGDSGLFGPNDNDNFFYNYVEFGTNPGGLDEVAIYDGCDRMIPLNMEAIPDLVQALHKAYELWMKINFGNKVQTIVENHGVEMYVEDNEITFDAQSVQVALGNAE
jgi:hypothetical protein